MLRILKFCRTFNDFIKTRNLNVYPTHLNKVLRRGIKPEEVKAFFSFFREKHKSADSNEDLEDELADLKKRDFLEQANFNFPNRQTEVLITLGWKGRALLKGNHIKRTAYFVEFALEEHGRLYSFVLGGGVVAAIGVLTAIFLALLSFIKNLLHLL